MANHEITFTDSKKQYKPYRGIPFAGIQTIVADDLPKSAEIRTYCYIEASSETNIGGMQGIPFKDGALESLVETVVRKHGADYRNRVTFEPPQSLRVGCDENGWCNIEFEALPKNELEKFHLAAESMIQSHKK